MKNTPTLEQAQDFFQKEEEDWQLVKQASLDGDEAATLALSTVKIINDELDFLFAVHEKQYYLEDPGTYVQRMDECNKIMERVASLIIQRRSLLYDDYKIHHKRLKISIDHVMLNDEESGNNVIYKN